MRLFFFQQDLCQACNFFVFLMSQLCQDYNRYHTVYFGKNNSKYKHLELLRNLDGVKCQRSVFNSTLKTEDPVLLRIVLCLSSFSMQQANIQAGTEMVLRSLLWCGISNIPRLNGEYNLAGGILKLPQFNQLLKQHRQLPEKLKHINNLGQSFSQQTFS